MPSNRGSIKISLIINCHFSRHGRNTIQFFTFVPHFFLGQMVDLSLVEFSPDFISGYDEHLNVVIWNPAIAEKYNVSKEEAIGKNLTAIFPRLKPDDFRLQCLRQ